jgi:hypothetical protein
VVSLRWDKPKDVTTDSVWSCPVPFHLSLVYLMTVSVAAIKSFQMMISEWMLKWKRCGKKISWPYLKCCPGICLERLKKPARISDFRPEVWTSELTKTKQEFCRIALQCRQYSINHLGYMWSEGDWNCSTFEDLSSGMLRPDDGGNKRPETSTRLHSTIYQKTVFILAAVRTRNLLQVVYPRNCW